MKLYEILSDNKKDYEFSCIYLWTNLVNGKHYVGQTQNFYSRMYQYNKTHGNKYLKNAISKYTLENFEIEVLEKTDIENLDSREQYWLDYYCSYERDKGYNICQFASTTRGYKHTPETREILSQKRKENPVSLAGENNPMYGKTHTEEWRKNHSDWLKNKWETDEEYRNFWHDKMSGENNYFYGKSMSGDKNPMYGKHHSEETKQKISEANKGKYNGKSTKVICVETQEIFESINKAAQHFDSNINGIYVALDKENRTCKGYHFKRLV